MSGGGFNGSNPYTQQQQQAQAAQVLTPEEQAARDAAIAQAQTNVANSGANMGSLWGNPGAYNRSAVRYDQTAAERVAQQQANYMYGGYAGGATDAVAAARNAVSPAATTLQQMGGAYYGQAGVGQENMGTGLAGLYGTADALNQYAAQGPGPSLAQAQLEANTAAAMRQQLAIAGSGRGAGGGAAAYRNAAAQQAMIQGGANAQAAMLQAQEAQNWRQAQLQAMGAAGGMYGQGAGIGSEYATNMSGLASQATQGSGQMALSGEQLANQVNMAALQGSQAYEQNLTDIYGIDRGVPKGVDEGNPLMAAAFGAAGTLAGAYFGGPVGAAAGGSLGTAVGNEL